MAIDPAHRPARRAEAQQLIVEHDSDVAPSMEIWLSSNSTIRRASYEMPTQRDRFMAEALHQAAIAGNHVGEVIDQRVAKACIEQPLGQRHADCGGDPLPQWLSRGLDTRGMAVFQDAPASATPLDENALSSSSVIVSQPVRCSGA